MGLSSAMDWWDEWKLRILVLSSLFVQFLLLFSSCVRNFYALRKLRVIVWLAYIGGDALAVYALATLFNRHKQQTMADGGGGSSSALEVIWAPVLLIHLGGQIYISAYSLEDNELWKRHAVSLVSQVTVALYVFCKWWSGESETRLLQAAVLLFIAGILTFGQKPWALSRASYGNMASTYLSPTSPHPPRSVEGEESSSLWRRSILKFCISLCSCANLFYIIAQLEEKPRGGGLVEEEEGTNHSLEDYVKEAQEHVKQGPKLSAKAQREKFKKNSAIAFVWMDMHKLFLDLSAQYSVRLHYLPSFLNLDEHNQHSVLEQWIFMQFAAIYTRMTSTTTCLGLCSNFVVPSLTLASVVLFAKSDEDGYNKSDITVTYILFCGTLVIELAPLVLFLCLSVIITPCNNILARQLRWEDMVAQHNIMSVCARNKQPPTLMKLATFSSYLKDYINKHWYIWHEPAAKHISMLVRHHAEEDGWKEYIRDAATYRRFNNLRGEHTLMKMSHHSLEQGKLGWTFNLPFDEYVLLWHLATDLCIYYQSTDDASASEGSISSRRRSSGIISNYMIYLLFICPEMLIPGTRRHLFVLACDDIERIVKDQPLPSHDERSIAQWVLRTGQDGDERKMRKSGVISNAYKLAKALIDLDNDTEMWKVIQGVWVEMLCYSASRSRGYLHAKNLAYGGEFLTNVWLLWWCMGMQTLPDIMNNLAPPEELTAVAAPV